MNPTLPTQSTMTVVIIMPLAEQRGGSELMLLQLLEHGRDAGVRWFVVFLEDGPMIQQARNWNIPVELVDAGRLRQPLKMLRAVRKIAAILRRENANLVLGWMAKPHLYGGPAALLAGVPAIWYQLGLPTGGLIDRLATAIPARGILACSRWAATAQEAMPPSRPVRVVYPGVELDRFNPADRPPATEVRRRLGLPLKGSLIGIVGRLQRWKGMHVLVAAMPAILQQFPDARCLIVGGEHKLEPEYSAFLRDQIAQLSLQDKVFLTGLRRDVADCMSAMDIVVHASDREPFGLVVIEAMALEKPVIATNLAGPAEIITHDQDGLLTTFGDAPALAAAVIRLLENPATARQLAIAARARAQDFSVARYVQAIVEAIESFVPQASTPVTATAATRDPDPIHK